MKTLWVALTVIAGGVCLLLVSKQLRKTVVPESEHSPNDTGVPHRTLVSGLPLSAGLVVRLRQLRRTSTADDEQGSGGGRGWASSGDDKDNLNRAAEDDLSAACHPRCTYRVETAVDDDSGVLLFDVRLVALGEEEDDANRTPQVLLSRPVVSYADDEDSFVVANDSLNDLPPTATLLTDSKDGRQRRRHRQCLFTATLLRNNYATASSASSDSSDYTASQASDSLVQSSSVVNLCRGMFGALATESGGVIFVEPTSRTATSGSSEERLHLLYRNPDGGKTSFDTDTFQASRAATSFFPDDFAEDHEENAAPNADDEAEAFSGDESRWTRRRGRRRRRGAMSWDYFIEVLVVTDAKMRQYHGNNLENYVLTLFSTQAPIITENAQETLRQFCRYQEDLNDDDDDSPNHHDVAILLTRKDICRASGKCDTLGLAELGTMCDRHRSCAIIEDNGLSASFTIAHELGHIFNIPHDDEKKCGEHMALTKYNFHIMAPTLEYNTHPWSWSPCSNAMLRKFLDTGRAQCLTDKPVEKKYFESTFEESSPGVLFDVNQQCKFVFGTSSQLCPYMPVCKRLWCATYYGYQMGCRTQHMPWADGTTCGDGKWCYRGQCVGMGPHHRRPLNGVWGAWKEWGLCSRTCGGGVKKAERDCDNPRPEHGGKYCVGQRIRYRSCNTDDCPWEALSFRQQQCASFNDKDIAIHGVPPKTSWVPKYTVSPNDRCKLYCKEDGKAAYYLLRDKVEDGTPCDRHSDDICVDGECKKAGCDHRLDSNMVPDRCGVCGGDGTGCEKTVKVFNQQVTFGYNHVALIPAGAARIDIRQTAHNNKHEDDNYLALQNSKGDFILNGQYQVSVFQQDVPVKGSILEYSGSDNIIERINSSAPTHEDIYLHVLSVGNLRPPQITYEYVQQHGRPTPRMRHYWRMSEAWSECSSQCQGQTIQKPNCVDAETDDQVSDHHCPNSSKPDLMQKMCNIDCQIKWMTEWESECSTACGTGERQQRAFCIKTYAVKVGGGTEEDRRLTDADCDAVGTLVRPPTRVVCHVDCRDGYRWSYSDWTECSQSCDGGRRMRQAACVDGANRRLDDEATSKHCRSLPKEQHEESCNVVPCPKWSYGDWSECTQSCDGGTEIRHARCLDAAGREVPREMCAVAALVDRRACNEHKCTRWHFGQWTACTVTCGDGTASRDAHCVDSKMNRLDETSCDKRQKIVAKACRVTACPKWRISQWTQCSKTCTDGWQKRKVECVDEKGVAVDNTRCFKAGEKYAPPSHKECNHGLCPFWRTGSWTPCSVTCGDGSVERNVECVHGTEVVDKSYCANMNRPSRQIPCRLVPCPHWEVEPWNKCSTSCGAGVERRRLRCMTDQGITRDIECNVLKRPQETKECFIAECPIATRETTTTTAMTTAASTQPTTPARTFTTTTTTAPARSLGVLKAPKTVEWITGPWTPCYGTCTGGGERKRQAVCKDIYQRILDDKYCRIDEKPADREPCLPDRCQTDTTTTTAITTTTTAFTTTTDNSDPPTVAYNRSWTTGPWTPCSKSCGADSITTRRVWCLLGDGGSAGRCDPRARPRDWKRCQVAPCVPPSLLTTTPTTTAVTPTSTVAVLRESHWHTGAWLECSAAGADACVGGGWRRRLVMCLAGSADEARRFCRAEDKPTSVQSCRPSSCPPRRRWRLGPWLKCSRSCDGGVQHRMVLCTDGGGGGGEQRATRVADSLCAHATKPTSQRRCNREPCHHQRRPPSSKSPLVTITAAWRAGPWSSCSRSCGKGTMRRLVECIDRGNNETISETECGLLPKPIATHRCRKARCPRWRKDDWSACSTTCGSGIRSRTINCYRGRKQQVSDTECATLKRPPIVSHCKDEPCPTYKWKTGRWTNCSEICRPGEQRRAVFCISDEGKRALPRVCDQKHRPATVKPCMNPICPYKWEPGPWTMCSQSCGAGGLRFRSLNCVVKRGVLASASSASRSGHGSSSGVQVASRMCSALPRPTAVAKCSLGECTARHRWTVDAWTQCSTTCGVGLERRRVRCVTQTGHRAKKTDCPPELRPARKRRCFTRNCEPGDCAEIKQHNSQAVQDGDFFVLVSGFKLQVYCHAMNESHPQTYVTLRRPNWAEMYPRLLLYPFTCPYSGARNDSCLCNADGNPKAGRTVWHKIRVDLHNMKVNTHDFTFAEQKFGKEVTYASAGDCYSAVDCPQAGTTVTGKCGGYCGECYPDKWIGLLIEIDRPHKKLL